MSNYDYRYNVKVAVDLAIRDAKEENEYRVKEGIAPCDVSDLLEEMGWEWSSRDSGFVDEWTLDEYINEAYPNIILFVNWNGWYGISDISARLEDAEENSAI